MPACVNNNVVKFFNEIEKISTLYCESVFIEYDVIHHNNSENTYTFKIIDLNTENILSRILEYFDDIQYYGESSVEFSYIHYTNVTNKVSHTIVMKYISELIDLLQLYLQKNKYVILESLSEELYNEEFSETLL